MPEKNYPFFCEWCGTMKYCVAPENSGEDPIDILCRTSPQYICADCLRKILKKEE